MHSCSPTPASRASIDCPLAGDARPAHALRRAACLPHRRHHRPAISSPRKLRHQISHDITTPTRNSMSVRLAHCLMHPFTPLRARRDFPPPDLAIERFSPLCSPTSSAVCANVGRTRTCSSHTGHANTHATRVQGLVRSSIGIYKSIVSLLQSWSTCNRTKPWRQERDPTTRSWVPT